jgi:phenylpropionate dioxygenase-like ring-hydroxylating dioxygenase large terminal subunit
MALTEIRLPQSGMGMTDGTILVWHKAVGERIEQGEPLCDIEAAKALVEMVAPVSGVIAKLLVQAGENVPVNTPIVMIDEGDATSAAPIGNADTAADAGKESAAPAVARARMNEHAAERGPSVQIEPRARRAAQQRGVDLTRVRGSGPCGRILEEDVKRYSESAGKPVLRDIQRGLGSAERPMVKDLWAADSQPDHIALRSVGNFEPDHVTVDFKRYYDPDFARREVDKLWRKSWLFAAREEDIPEVGDRIPFDVGPLSFFIVRTAEDEFRAFYNSCLHRGTALCSEKGNGATIRCPFHGWEWRIDGTLKHIPSHWDFRHVTPKNSALEQARVERWGGFLFIHADPDAPPLEEALSVIPAHFAGFDIANRYTAARFRKHIRANWKLVQEAFHESYHVLTTHPAATPYNGDCQSQYDIWETAHGHIGRQVAPSAVPSVYASPDATRLTASEVYAQIMKQWHYPDADLPVLDPSRDLRTQIADWHRAVQKQFYGRDVDLPDAIMVDSLLYFMFPHFTVWLSESLPFTYQFLPHATDPEQSYFDVRMLLPCPSGKPRPPSAPAIDVSPDETIESKCPDFGFLATVFDQDMANMPRVQRGVKAAKPGRHTQLSTYQEMIVQHWNALVDQYLGR